MDNRNSGLNKNQINYMICTTHDGSAFENGPHTSFAACPISHFPSSCTSARSNSTSFNCFARFAFCMNRRLRVPVLRVLLVIVICNYLGVKLAITSGLSLPLRNTNTYDTTDLHSFNLHSRKVAKSFKKFYFCELTATITQ